MLATTLLCEQHRRIEELILRVGQERADRRLPLVLQLVEELMTHLSIEDHFFLATVADATGLRVDGFREDQARVRNAVLQTVFAEDQEPVFVQLLRELSSGFERHAKVLERDLLPLVDAQLPGDDLETMGARMQSYWEAALGAPGRAAPAGHVHARRTTKRQSAPSRGVT
jgi:hypothetical protein